MKILLNLFFGVILVFVALFNAKTFNIEANNNGNLLIYGQYAHAQAESEENDWESPKLNDCHIRIGNITYYSYYVSCPKVGYPSSCTPSSCTY